MHRIEEFLEHLQLDVRASKQTVRGYGTDLREFRQFLATRIFGGRIPDEKSIDHLTIRAYLSFLHDRGVSRATIARKLAALRSYFRYLIRIEVLKRNPASLVATPRLDQRLPHPMPQDEVESLLDSAFGKDRVMIAIARSWSFSTQPECASASWSESICSCQIRLEMLNYCVALLMRESHHALGIRPTKSTAVHFSLRGRESVYPIVS